MPKRNILATIATWVVGIFVAFAIIRLVSMLSPGLRHVLRDLYGGVGIIFLAGAAILFTFAIASVVSAKRFRRSSRTVQGTFVDHVSSVNSEGQTSYYPRFSFTTGGGKKIVVESQLGTNPPMYKEGQTLDIVYDPSKPEHAEIDAPIDLYSRPLIYILFAVMLSIWGGCCALGAW